jgi:hypothetical protein
MAVIAYVEFQRLHQAVHFQFWLFSIRKHSITREASQSEPEVGTWFPNGMGETKCGFNRGVSAIIVAQFWYIFLPYMFIK